MGIEARLKSVSETTFEIIFDNPNLLADIFLITKWLPESAFWNQKKYLMTRDSPMRKAFLDTQEDSKKQMRNFARQHPNYNWLELENQFLEEWETPELDLHKFWNELTFLLAGYVPCDLTNTYAILEIKTNRQKDPDLSLQIIEESLWDGLPLVDAICMGKQLSDTGDYGGVRCLTNDEVGRVLDALLFLTEDGFKERYHRESQKIEPCPYIDWSEEETLDWLTDYYRQIVNYYHDTYHDNKALLLYFT